MTPQRPKVRRKHENSIESTSLVLRFFTDKTGEPPFLVLEENLVETSNMPAPRTPLNLDVTFKKNYARQPAKGTLKNISITGAFLECEQDSFRTNEKIQLKFVVAGRERSIAATVIWTNSAGCGVKFHPTSNRDVQIVDDLIYFVESGRDTRRSVLDDIFKKVA